MYINNFIFSHGIIDILNYDNYIDFIINYILFVIILEYCIYKLKDFFIFVFILLSAIHFSDDFKYITNHNQECIYYSTSFIVFSIFNNDCKNVFRRFFKILKFNNFVFFYNYLKMISALMIFKALSSENIHIYMYLFILNCFINPYKLLQLYFVIVHIPITFYNSHQKLNAFYLILFFNLILNNLHLKLYNRKMVITGLSISTVHILNSIINKYKFFS